MKQISDIRLGGTLLSVATLICGGFAVAALIPLIQWNPGRLPTDMRTPAPVQPLVHHEQQRFREFQTEPVHSQTQQESAGAAVSKVASGEDPPGSQFVTRASSGGTAAADPAFQQTASPRGVYVPVNVHPVTVNVDGSALAEQLSVLTNGVDDMLAAHRELSQSYHLATASPSADAQTGRHEERLTQIDASVRELANRVESLRTESRTADSRLTEEVRQAKLASDLLREFRLTLAEHRQFLADSARSFPTSSARIAQHPEPGTDPSSEKHEELSIPELLETDPEPPLWGSPEDVEKPDGPDVPLPPDADKRTSSITSPPKFARDLLPTGAQSRLPAVEPPLVTDDWFAMADSRDTTTNMTDESKPRLAMFAPPHRVIVERDSTSENRPLNLLLPPKDDEQSTTAIPVDAASGMPEAVNRGANPVVFEQTYSFVLPPATNPLNNLQNNGVDNAGRAEYAQPATFQESIAASHTAVPVAGSHAVATASVNSEATPSTPAGNRIGIKRLYSKFAFTSHASAASKNRQPSSPQVGLHGDVASVRGHSMDVRGHVYEETGRRRHRHSSARTNTRKRPSVLHRLASSIRRVGRSRTID